MNETNKQSLAHKDDDEEEEEVTKKLELLKNDINKNMNGLSFVSILFDINYYVYFFRS